MTPITPVSRAQQVTVAPPIPSAPTGGKHAPMAAVAIVVVIQWVLLTVAIEGYMGGHSDLLGYATLASFLCLAAAWGLTRYVR